MVQRNHYVFSFVLCIVLFEPANLIVNGQPLEPKVRLVEHASPPDCGSHNAPLDCNEPHAELKTLLVIKATDELGRPVTVVIKRHRQMEDWVFLVGAPRELNGAPVDYASTLYASFLEQGILDDVLLALVHRSGEKLELLGFSLGATDAPFIDWAKKFGVPLEIFDN